MVKSDVSKKVFFVDLQLTKERRKTRLDFWVRLGQV